MKQYEPKTNEPFQRWLNKYYPDENGIRDRYDELWREYYPRKYSLIALANLLGILVGALIVTIYWPEGDLIWSVFSIIVWSGILVFACFVLVYTPMWFNRRSAKPTPKREKK